MSRISVYIKFFLGSVSQSLSSGSTLERAHHRAWLSNWCSVFYPIWSASCRLLPALYRLAVCTHSNVTKRVSLSWFSWQLQIEEHTLWQSGAKHNFESFYHLLMCDFNYSASSLSLDLAFTISTYSNSKLHTLTLNLSSSMQPSLICFPPPGSDLFCFRLSRCFLFNCCIELTIFYPANK